MSSHTEEKQSNINNTGIKNSNDANDVTKIGEISKLKPKKGFLIFKMYTPDKIYFEGYVKSVSAINETGPFDILPGHHNFISMVTKCNVRIVVLENQPAVTISMNNGLMHVRDDRVIIFLDV